MSEIVEKLRVAATKIVTDGPVMYEAADEITRLKAEVERLRGALAEIIQDSFSVYAIQVARAALTNNFNIKED